MSTPSELFDLSGKTAIVTGGGTGIGRQMAEGLAQAGASVFICARDGARCEAAAAQLREAGLQAGAGACDLRDPEAIRAVVETAKERLGGRIDILVNNSGTTWAGSPEDTPLEGWKKVIDVNVTGVFLMSKAVGAEMIATGGGKIVNISSLLGTRGAPPDEVNAIAYTTSKGAVVTFTKDLAAKWAQHGIQVNAIAPGWFPSIMTDKTLPEHESQFLARIPMGRLGGPDDLKGAVVFLASPASNFVTGQVIGVDGGQSAI